MPRMNIDWKFFRWELKVFVLKLPHLVICGEVRKASLTCRRDAKMNHNRAALSSPTTPVDLARDFFSSLRRKAARPDEGVERASSLTRRICGMGINVKIKYYTRPILRIIRYGPAEAA